MYLVQQQQQQSQSEPRDRGVVDCGKCKSRITIDKPGNVAVEFSVPCPKCGHRGMYFKRMIYAESADPTERRRVPRD